MRMILLCVEVNVLAGIACAAILPVGRHSAVMLASGQRHSPLQVPVMQRLLLFGGGFIEGHQGRLAGHAAQRQRLALLALLAVEHPRPHTRDKLIAYLWPESDSERGRHQLRQLLYLLRGTLGEDAVLATGDELRLNPERLCCDVWEFQEALERGDLEAVVALYAGPFLDGVFLSDEQELEYWVDAVRARLALRFANTLEALGAQYEAAGELGAAAGAWRRLAEQDPYNSRYVLRLMQALAATGDRVGALRHAEMHATRLRTEFGAEPDPDLEALALRLREQPLSLTESAAPAALLHPPAAPHATNTTQAGDYAGVSAGARGMHAPGAPAGRPNPGAARRSLRHRFGLPRVQALVLAVVLALGMLGTLTAGDQGQRALARFGIGTGETLLSRGVVAERERILLADFTSPTGDTILASMATVAFRIDLSQSPILTLLEPKQVQEALARMQRSDASFLDPQLAREVALREGIKAVLVGELARSGGGYLLSAQLLATETGEILAAHRETVRDSTALLPALDRLSKRLRRRIGEPLHSLRSNPPLEQVTTSSLEALRQYSRAQALLRREVGSPRAIALLEEAVALDTTFAMAYRALAVALTNTGQQRERQVEMQRRAFHHRHRLTARERYVLLGVYHAFHSWEPEQAITALRSLLELYPHDATALNDLGVMYMLVGDYPRAEEFTHRSLQVDSSWAIVLGNLIMWQFNQGKLAQADSTYARLVQRFPETSHAWSALHLASATADFARAERGLRAERALKREDLFTQVLASRMLADLAAVHGRLGEAERLQREVSALSERRGLAGEHLLEAVHLAHLELSFGLPARLARERVERALESFPLAGMEVYDRPYADLAALYARAGQPALARALLAEWEEEAPLEQRRIVSLQRARPFWGRSFPWARGEILLAEGRPREAAEQFRVAHETGCLICTLPQLGRAYEAAGQPDSAIADYERYLRTPFFYRIFYDAEWRAPVLERLGQLYEARGEHARAAEHYAQFIELWQAADPELQPRVREARRRLAALQ
jgi:DNA-binding SARP family transcriptional activator/Tfp pilus assembly protein PilF